MNVCSPFSAFVEVQKWHFIGFCCGLAVFRQAKLLIFSELEVVLREVFLCFSSRCLQLCIRCGEYLFRPLFCNVSPKSVQNLMTDLG